MKHKILSVSSELLLETLCRDDRKHLASFAALGMSPGQPAKFITCDGMPDDARVVGVTMRPDLHDTIDLLIESDTFPEVPPGDPTPRFQVYLRSYTSYQTYVEMMSRRVINPSEAGDGKPLPQGYPVDMTGLPAGFCRLAKRDDPPAQKATPVTFREFL